MTSPWSFWPKQVVQATTLPTWKYSGSMFMFSISILVQGRDERITFLKERARELRRECDDLSYSNYSRATVGFSASNVRKKRASKVENRATSECYLKPSREMRGTV